MKNGSSRMEIEKGMSHSRIIIGMLNSILWSKNIIEKTKMTIFKTLMEIILLYGAVTWTMKPGNEKKTTFYRNGLLEMIGKNITTRKKNYC